MIEAERGIQGTSTRCNARKCWKYDATHDQLPLVEKFSFSCFYASDTLILACPKTITSQQRALHIHLPRLGSIWIIHIKGVCDPAVRSAVPTEMTRTVIRP